MASKESLTILVQLVNLAQKRGAYSVEESYLAFMAMKEFISDPKLDRAEELVKQLFNKDGSSKDLTQENMNEIAQQVNNLSVDNKNDQSNGN